MVIHGGNRREFLEKYGREPLDFSVNVNPLGMSPKAREAALEALDRGGEYPDREYAALRLAVGEHFGIPARYVIPGNGASDLIFRAAALLSGKRVLLTAPAFSEYEAALCAFGCRILYHRLLPENDFSLTEDVLEQITPALDGFFLCNPNNPTGTMVQPKLLNRIVKRCEECGTLLWVDECFNGFLDDPAAHSLVGRLSDCRNLIILQAPTKLYALAGLRLGYAFCGEESLWEKLWTYGQSWPVSAVAQAAGIAALKDEDYVERSLSLVRQQRAYLRAGLKSLSFRTVKGEANYLFFYTDIPDFADRLGERGILIRCCDSYRGLEKGYYRIAVRLPRENERLLGEMMEISGMRRFV